MKKYYKLVLLALFLFLIQIPVCNAAPNTYDYNNFRNMISQFQDYSIVPYGGSYYTFRDYSKAYANINNAAFVQIADNIKNFALSMNVYWESASDTPNIHNAGCGLRFRVNDTSALYAIMRMDGNLTVKGSKSGKSQSFGKFYYGRASIEAKHNLTVVANENNVKVFIDGKQYANARDITITRNGALQLGVVSGTNKDWGTRCEFTKINYYVW